MSETPHYTQHGDAPAITGAGFGMFPCACGKSLLIAGYEARNFLGISIQCAACGAISETPGLYPGVPPPANVTVIERGMANPPAAIDAATVLIGREEVARLAAQYQPRDTAADVHLITEALLDDVDFQQSRWTNIPLNPAPSGYQSQPLAWAVAHFRERLRQPDWVSFTDDADVVAVTVIAAVRDLFASWVHHPLFSAMVGTAAASGFSLHGVALAASAKALSRSGNRVAFVTAPGPLPQLRSLQLVLAEQAPMVVVTARYDRFEWPNGAKASPQVVLHDVSEAMDQVRGQVNRLHPGMLILSTGASDTTFDHMLSESLSVSMASQGKRHRGLAAVALIIPKVFLTPTPREARFGHTFYPVPNRHLDMGRSIQLASRNA